MCKAVFVYSKNYMVDCFTLDVFFASFPPQVLTSLHSCSCLLCDNISCHFLAGLSRFFDSCTDRFAGGGSGETSGDDSNMSSVTVILLAQYTYRFRFFSSDKVVLIHA